jgi:hypothetical protein
MICASGACGKHDRRQRMFPVPSNVIHIDTYQDVFPNENKTKLTAVQQPDMFAAAEERRLGEPSAQRAFCRRAPRAYWQRHYRDSKVVNMFVVPVKHEKDHHISAEEKY